MTVCQPVYHIYLPAVYLSIPHCAAMQIRRRLPRCNQPELEPDVRCSQYPQYTKPARLPSGSVRRGSCLPATRPHKKLFSACTFPDLKNIFDTFLPQLLLYPNPTGPLNGEAAALMMREPEKYAARIKGTPAHHSTLPLPGLRTQ